MAVSLEVIRKLTVQASAQGVDAVRAQLEGIDRAQQGVAKSADVIRQANDNTAKSVLSSAKAFDNLERAIDPVARANARLAADQAKVNRALNEGAVSADRAANVTSLLGKRHEEAIAKVAGHTTALALNRNEWINLGRQAQDVGTMLAMGMSPMQVLTSQGAQIADVFASSSGGAAAAMKEFGGVVARVALNPITLFAAGAGTAALATMRWKEQTDALTFSLNGLGRASGLTVSGASSIAERAATGANISNASARGMAAQFLGAGVPGTAVGGAIGIATDFGRKLGLSQEEAAKTLSTAFADPAKGAEELASRFGMVTFAQREEIKQLAAVGDKSGAASRLFDALTKSLEKMADPTTRWQKMLDGIGKRMSDKFDEIAKGFEGPKSYKDSIGKIAEQARRAKEARDSQDQQRAQELDRMRQDGAFAAREVAARTFAEREAISVEKARVDTLRQTNDAVKAGIAAENERAKMLAEATRKVDDYVREGKRQVELAGLSPYEQGLRKLQFEAQDLKDQTAPYKTAGEAVTRFADVVDQAAARIGGGTPGVSGSTPSFAGGGAGFDPRGISGYIGARAAAYGIDPKIALRVARSEGLGTFTGDAGSSYGAFQLHRGGIARGGNAVPGLGDDFFKATGLDPSNPANERATIDYALKWASRHGWGAFHGAARAGIGNFQGIGTSASTNDNAARIDNGFSQYKKAYDIAQIDEPLKKVNDDIAKQRALLEAQAAAFGKSTEETARAAKEQELLNQFQQQGVPITDRLRASVGEAAKNYGSLAQAQEDVAKKQRDLVSGMDEFRGISKESIGSLISDLRQGQRFGDALASSLDQVANKLISISLDKMISGAFGESGKSGGGLFGDAIGGFMKGIFGFADGGVMTSHGPIPLRRYADGGVASSPQLAMFGEGSGPEAYVPLKNGGIPVHIRMAREAAQASASSNQAAAPNTEVHVHNAPPGTQTKESQTSAGGRRVDVMFADAVGGALQTGAGRRGLAMATSRPVQR